MRPQRRAVGILSKAAGALSVALVPAVALGLYLSLGMPVWIAAVIGLGLALSWASMRHRAPASWVGEAPIRLAAAHGHRSAVHGARGPGHRR